MTQRSLWSINDEIRLNMYDLWKKWINSAYSSTIKISTIPLLSLINNYVYDSSTSRHNPGYLRRGTPGDCALCVRHKNKSKTNHTFYHALLVKTHKTNYCTYRLKRSTQSVRKNWHVIYRADESIFTTSSIRSKQRYSNIIQTFFPFHRNKFIFYGKMLFWYTEYINMKAHANAHVSFLRAFFTWLAARTIFQLNENFLNVFETTLQHAITIIHAHTGATKDEIK